MRAIVTAVLASMPTGKIVARVLWEYLTTPLILVPLTGPKPCDWLSPMGEGNTIILLKVLSCPLSSCLPTLD